MTHYEKMSKSELIELLRERDNLRSSEYELAAIVGSTNAAIIGMTLDGVITSWNKGAENIYGYFAGEIIGQNITLLSPHDRHEEVSQILERIKRGESVEHFETVHNTKDGRDVHISLVMAPVLTMAGGIIGVSSSATDITKRKLAEKALRHSEQLYRAIGESINYGVWVCAPDGRNIYASKSFLEMVGLTQEQCSNFGWGEVLHPDDAERTIAAWKECVRKEGTWDIEHRFRGVDGKWHDVLARGVPVRDEQGRITCWAGINLDISTHKQDEESQRISEQRYRSLFENMLDGVEYCKMLFDNQGHPADFVYLDVNSAFQRLYGLENVVGKKISELIPGIKESHPELFEIYGRVALTGQPETFEFEYKYFRKWLSISVYSPEKEYFVAVLENITGRKLAEEKLRKSNQRLDLLAQTASQLLKSDSPQEMVDYLCRKVLAFLDCDAFFNYLVDEEKQQLHLNACGGIPAEDMQKMEWLDYGVGLCGCSARDGCRLVVDNVQETQDQYTALVKPFGIQAYACHPLISQGRVLGTLSFCTRNRTHFADDELSLMKAVADQVTIALKRKMVEEELFLSHSELELRVKERTEQLQKTAEALCASEERYALAVQGSNDGIWDLNLATDEAYHSPRWKSILGFEGDEITGNFKEWKSRIHPDDYQMVMAAFKAYLEGHTPTFEVEHRLQHKDGSYRWILSRGVCLRDFRGRAYRMAGSITDITEHKKLEQQLLQSQKMESVGILAGGVAHEFNNLLLAILGYGKVLQESIPADDEHSQESIANVIKAADRAADLTKSLLAFSRKQLIIPKPVHINTLIGNTGKLIQRVIGEDIEFRTSFSDKNLLVIADPGQIEQVLMNMATNARDAMPHGGCLSITTKQVFVKKGSEAQYDLPVPGKYALISVADTGTGIDEKSLESIFEPFYTSKEVGKGTGLGLSIVHGIIKQHNGSILASSEPSEGTTFNIYLPLVEGHAVKEESKTLVPLAHGRETLLVAEDEEVVRMFMKKILERAGYKVIIAENGEDAVTRFREHDDISLVLSDVLMPRKNGKEMLDELRVLKPGVKVIFISGYAADVMQKKGLFEEGTEFITKPFDANDLLQKVREELDKD
jgi:PAS domain S-box-containing protein